MEILLGDVNVNSRTEDIKNESLHGIRNYNSVGIVNFVISSDLIVERTMFPHRNNHKYTWTAPDRKTHT
jgi:hypothetical protein